MFTKNNLRRDCLPSTLDVLVLHLHKFSASSYLSSLLSDYRRLLRTSSPCSFLSSFEKVRDLFSFISFLKSLSRIFSSFSCLCAGSIKIVCCKEDYFPKTLFCPMSVMHFPQQCCQQPSLPLQEKKVLVQSSSSGVQNLYPQN